MDSESRALINEANRLAEQADRLRNNPLAINGTVGAEDRDVQQWEKINGRLTRTDDKEREFGTYPITINCDMQKGLDEINTVRLKKLMDYLIRLGYKF